MNPASKLVVVSDREVKPAVAAAPTRSSQPRGRRPLATARRLRDGIGRGWRSYRRATFRYRAVTDVLSAVFIVTLLVVPLAAISGGTWPPAVVVESGSMMHNTFETPYGRFGTIDVGDMVLVKGVRQVSDVELWVDGGRDHYGRPGDVLAFIQDGDQGISNLTIIHRAMTWVETTRDADNQRQYRVKWLDGEMLIFGPEGIYIPEFGIDEDWGFTPEQGYQPSYSGFITKGDNPATNPAADQAAGISGLVRHEWVRGTMYGEVPWIGLARLALAVGQTNPVVTSWERVGNAYAPLELWSVFFFVVALAILVPIFIDTVRAIRRHRAAVRLAAEIMREQHEAAEALRRARAARAKASFAVVRR